MAFTRARIRWTALAAVGCSALLLASPVRAQTTRYDPRLRFQTLSTGRFTIYFHQREEDLARRLARIAEAVASDMSPRLGAPRGRVHVILVDQADDANGWATVIPYNLIEITAAPPPAYSLIGNTDDWLRMVFAHEYTHVVHLERSGGWFGSLRHVFGRLPLFYSNLALPDWQIEGVATHEESAITGRGRIPAGDFRMILDVAAAGRRFAPLDRATGAVVDWPSGTSPYLFGGFFHAYLARRYGDESLARLADETASRLPFLGSRAFRRVYGRSLGQLWKDFEADTRRRSGLTASAAQGDSASRDARGRSATPERTRLTRSGFVTTSPYFSGDGRLFYSIATPHAFPALMELGRDGRPRQVATRYRGSRLAGANGLLVFDQLDLFNEVGLQSDLYAVRLDGGHRRRLTGGARAGDPDVAPDGQTIVCTVQETGRRILATLKLSLTGERSTPVPLVAEASTEFSAPRWSPDGRSIVAERRRLGGPSEIVVIDVATRAARAVVSSAAARNTLPGWLPDGRTILFSSDRDGGAFTLYAADAGTGDVTRIAGAGIGAQAPAVSPDGRRLVFVGYSADGYDLYAIPVDRATWAPVAEPETSPPDIQRRVTTPPAGTVTGPGAYRPWPTLAPRFWVPVVESDGDDVVVGAATGGSDVLGRHLYTGTFGWGVDRNRPDVQVDYAYARWWPTVFASAATDTDRWRTGEVRAREVMTGAVFPVRRVRWNSAAMGAWFSSTETFECQPCAGPQPSRLRRNALRAGWSWSSARRYGYSISAEEGFSLAAASEVTRRALGADGDASALVVDVRKYVHASPRHAVVAARFAVASSWGDARLRRVYSAGGSGPQPGGFDLDFDAVGLLRGFKDVDLIGNRAASLNLDYRVPLAWVQRGIGTWPVFLRSIHGAIFADAGEAWDRTFRSADIRKSFGGELSFDAVFASSLSLTITTGVAWRHDGPAGRDVVTFARIGRAF